MTPAPLLLSLRSAARACDTSVTTFRRWHDAGLVGPRAVKIGAGSNVKLYFNAGELGAWVNDGCPPRDDWLARKR